MVVKKSYYIEMKCGTCQSDQNIQNKPPEKKSKILDQLIPTGGSKGWHLAPPFLTPGTKGSYILFNFWGAFLTLLTVLNCITLHVYICNKSFEPWLLVSQRIPLTDLTLAHKDINSILSDHANREIPGNGVSSKNQKILNFLFDALQ